MIMLMGGDIALTLKPVDGTTGKVQQHLKLLIMVVHVSSAT
jgi:hypothetical protein